MILLKSLPNVNVLCARSSIVVYFIYLQLLLVFSSIQICLSFPMESFFYETNPVQKHSFQYNQDGFTRPIRFKLQNISFKINEQLPTLDVYQDSMQKSAENSFPIRNETKMTIKEELRESENKFHPLIRFTEFYNTPENLVSNNVANNDMKQVNSTTEDQTETEGSHSNNNTNRKDTKTAHREKNKFDANSVTGTNLGIEDETTESEQSIVKMQGIQINKINKEKINSLLGTVKNEYQIITVQDVTEPVITTGTILETGDEPSESYEIVGNEKSFVNPKENNESDYESKYYEISNDKNIGHHQTAESITIEDLQTDIYDNITTEGYTQTDKYEDSDNITESENRTTNSSK